MIESATILPLISLPFNLISRFLYTLFVGIDGNFWLKRKKVSTEERDPSLNEGWAFFIEEGEYKKHLESEAGCALSLAPMYIKQVPNFFPSSAASVLIMTLSTSLIVKHKALQPRVL